MTRVRIRRRILPFHAAELGASGTGKRTERYGIPSYESLSEQRSTGVFRTQLAICGDSLCSDALASSHIGFL